MPDAPALVLVALTLAALLLLVEVALPTFGLAGLSAFGLGTLAVALLAEQSESWWPLVLCVLSVCVWAMLLATKRPGLLWSLIAAKLFALGSIVYGIVNDDVLSILVGVAAAVALALGFPRLMRVTTRLLEGPPHVGMDALVGRRARVVRWESHEGTVRLEGALWNARSAAPLHEGDDVTIAGYEGMTLDVTPASTAVPMSSADGREA